MLLIPIAFVPLLHDIIPGIDIVVIILENVEGRTGQSEEPRAVLPVVLYELLDNVVA